jgi:predicted PurR-regulated permease PerM
LISKAHWHTIIATIVLVVFIVFLYRVREILPPFIISIIIAWLLDPVIDRMQRYGLSRFAGVCTVYIVFLTVFILTLRFLIPIVVHEVQQLPTDFPKYSEKFLERCSSYMEKHKQVLVKLGLPSTPEKVIQKYSTPVTKWIASKLKDLQKLVLSHAEKALWLILIPLLSFYLINDLDRLRNKVVLIIPSIWRQRSTEILSKIARVFGSYVRGLIVVCLLYGVVSSAILASFGVRYGVVIGLISGILYAVPFLGAILITLMVFLVALATKGLAFGILMALVMFILNQVVFDMLLTPRIIGKSVGLHPVLSLFALFAGQELFGLPGMILAVPIAASIQETILEFSPELRGNKKVLKTHRKTKNKIQSQQKERE